MIDHRALMDRVRGRVGDKRVLALIKAFLRAGILSEDGLVRNTSTGTPQGGILSPLLANIALSRLNQYFADAWQTASATTYQRTKRRRGGLPIYRIVRYADDFVVLVAGTEAHARSLRETVAAVLAPMGLRLSEVTSSTHSTTALSGGLRYSPTTSRTFASSCGSVENLNVSRRQGCSPYSRHTSATFTFERPISAASSRLDQCVTPSLRGGGSSVRSTIATSSVVRGRPGLRRSSSPPRPSAAYRRFQAMTVGFDTPTRVTISFVPAPSAASRTIRARWASPALIDGDRHHEESTSRSRGETSTLTVNGIIHDPVTAIIGQGNSLTPPRSRSSHHCKTCHDDC